MARHVAVPFDLVAPCVCRLVMSSGVRVLGLQVRLWACVYECCGREREAHTSAGRPLSLLAEGNLVTHTNNHTHTHFLGWLATLAVAEVGLVSLEVGDANLCGCVCVCVRARARGHAEVDLHHGKTSCVRLPSVDNGPLAHKVLLDVHV